MIQITQLCKFNLFITDPAFSTTVVQATDPTYSSLYLCVYKLCWNLNLYETVTKAQPNLCIISTLVPGFSNFSHRCPFLADTCRVRHILSYYVWTNICHSHITSFLKLDTDQKNGLLLCFRVSIYSIFNNTNIIKSPLFCNTGNKITYENRKEYTLCSIISHE